MSWVLVVVGAVIGAPLRYLADRAVQARHDSVFPWGTFVVNASGSLVLGVLTGAVAVGAASSSAQLMLGVGLCGAFTTYSTFSYETVRLAEHGWTFLALANAAASLLVGLGSVFLGATVVEGLLG